MKFYNYNEDGFFTTIGETEKCQITGKDLKPPANATLIEPPTAENRVAKFVAGQWDLVEDNRGTIVTDIATQKEFAIDYIGQRKTEHTLALIPAELKGIAKFNGTEWVVDNDLLAKRESAAALAYLAETDWYVTRSIETQVEVPAEVTIKRAEAREKVL